MNKYIYNVDGSFTIKKNFYSEQFESLSISASQPGINVSSSVQTTGNAIIDGLSMSSSGSINGKGVEVGIKSPNMPYPTININDYIPADIKALLK